MATKKIHHKLPLLIVVFIVLVAISVGMIKTNHMSRMREWQRAAVTGSTNKISETLINESLKAGRAVKMPINETINSSFRQVIVNAFGSTGLPNAYMYYCRNSGDSTGYLYQSQINLGSSYQSSSSACVQIAD